MVYGYIYKIENVVNGKVYIGQTIQNPINRRNSHFAYLKNNKHYNEHLQNAFNKYGESNFKFTVLNYATSKEVLDQLEDDYINYYDCLNPKNGYNLKSGGANGKPTLETRKKMSESNKGRKVSLETRMKLSKSRQGINSPLFGKKRSIEICNKISESHKGKTHSMIHRKRNSESHRGNGLFAFTGATLLKRYNPENKPWQFVINYGGKGKHFDTFSDPLTCEILYYFVKDELYN